MDSYEGFFATKCALRLAPLVFVRPGELRKAQWPEIDLDKAEWRIPAERMKMAEQHIVPLSDQAVEILRELEPLTNREIPLKPDAPRYVFPGARSRERPMSENAILAALRRMGCFWYTDKRRTNALPKLRCRRIGLNRFAVGRRAGVPAMTFFLL